MSLTSVILLALSAGFLIIGIIEIINYGVSQAYAWLMLSVVFFFVHAYRKLTSKK